MSNHCRYQPPSYRGYVLALIAGLAVGFFLGFSFGVHSAHGKPQIVVAPDYVPPKPPLPDPTVFEQPTPAPELIPRPGPCSDDCLCWKCQCEVCQCKPSPCECSGPPTSPQSACKDGCCRTADIRKATPIANCCQSPCRRERRARRCRLR